MGCPASTRQGRNSHIRANKSCLKLMTQTIERPVLMPRAAASLSGFVLGAVVLVMAIAPLATDMYVPAFPLVGRDLSGSASQVQLTLTTFFVGMALGQLAGGPVSDRVGRRVPLLVSLGVLVAASAACAVSPSIPTMMTARFVQGFSGGWAMVIARSVVVDLTTGAALVRAMNVIAGAVGVAPVIGPLLGAAILQFSHWRVSFWMVGVLAIGMLVVATVGVPETLPPTRRHGGGSLRDVGATRRVLHNRRFVGYLVVFGFSMGTTFAYVATSAFVLQSMNGLSPIAYSIDFAANAVGMTVATFVAARLAGRVPTRTIVGVGLTATAASAAMLLLAASIAMPLPLALIGFFVLMSGQGLIAPNAGALASAEVPDQPGTGSALLGCLQWVMAGAIAPVAGLGGEHTSVPMAVVVTVLTATSVVALAVLARPTARSRLIDRNMKENT
jgi:MFS transporter, DHA1 family, multidrug resistance protein